MEDLKDWSAEPPGRHQEPYPSAALPTALVRESGHEPYDTGRSVQPPPPTTIGFAPPPDANGAGSAGVTGYAPDPPLPPPPQAYLEGWHPDPSGQLRYFVNGQPTAWVNDGTGAREEHAPSLLTPPNPLEATPGVDDPHLQSAVADPGPRDEQTARPPGWYRNASDPNDVRYWDGANWIGQLPETSDAQPGASVETSTNGAAPAAPEQPAAGEGWQHDPLGRYKFRWFSSGEATSFVSDGDGRAFDESDAPRAQGPESQPAGASTAVDSPADPFAGLYSDAAEPAQPLTWESPPATVQEDHQLNGAHAAPAGPAAEPQDDLVSKLERLAALRDAGALSHDEFGVAKQRLLSS